MPSIEITRYFYKMMNYIQKRQISNFICLFVNSLKIAHLSYLLNPIYLNASSNSSSEYPNV